MGEVCSTCGERRNAYRALVVKPEGKGPFGRPVRVLKDNIKIDLQEIDGRVVDLISLAENRDMRR